MRPLAILTAAMLGAACAGAEPALGHDHWRWIKDNPVTAYCCGKDCREVSASEITYARGRWHVNGQPIAKGDTHSTPPDIRRPWACFPVPDWARCLFLPE